MINMIKKIFGSLLATMAFISTLEAATNNMKEYYSIVIENFNNPENREWVEEGQSKTEPRKWTIQGSMHATKGSPEVKHIPGSPTKRIYVAPSQEENILGVRSKFDYRGYNYFKISPMVNDDQEGFLLPDNARALSLWVWGSNYNYTIEVQLADHNGKVYVIPMGSLHFLGWRNLTIRIPESYTKAKYSPWGEPLKFLRFVVRTSPSERVHDFQIYLDDLRVETVRDQSPYSGGELFDPKRINQIWNNGQ